jgi:gluconokinase
VGKIRILVIMGVTGCGKSTVGRALAEDLGWNFVEGDAFHGPLNLSKLVRGECLTDEDRLFWVQQLAQEIKRSEASRRRMVLACSALKKSQRDILASASSSLAFVHLHGTPEAIARRLEQRTGHFANAALLPGQVAALEPSPEALQLDALLTVPELVSAIKAHFGARLA